MGAMHSDVVAWSTPSMGGVLTVAINTGQANESSAIRDAGRVGRRVNAWADRLTRFSTTSDLSQLNATSEERVALRPTLAAVLDWARVASERTHGVVDPTLLDARLAAQGLASDSERTARAWTLSGSGRAVRLEREAGTRFDLDGLAKGWLADRAVELLAAWPAAAVAADGDVAVSCGPGVEWLVGVSDPRPESRADDGFLATLRVRGESTCSTRFGVATSGTSVHRWQQPDGSVSHHLIDPRTGGPAETDIVQATIVAPSAREAEVIAKTAVILGSQDALPYLDGSAALAALLLLESGEVACLPGIEQWLA